MSSFQQKTVSGRFSNRLQIAMLYSFVQRFFSHRSVRGPLSTSNSYKARVANVDDMIADLYKIEYI